MNISVNTVHTWVLFDILWSPHKGTTVTKIESGAMTVNLIVSPVTNLGDGFLLRLLNVVLGG